MSNYRSTYNYDDDDDLEKIQEKISRTEDASLSSTRRTRALLDETTEVGIKTSEELVRQGEKLQNIDRHLDDIHQNLDDTQKDINKMKGFFGRIKSKFSGKSDKIKESKSVKETSSSSSSSKAKTANGSLRFETEPKTQASQFATISGSDREKEINEDLAYISKGLGNLKSMALDMNVELDKQNSLINRLDTKVDNTNTRIVAQDKQVKKIIGNKPSSSEDTDIVPSKLKLASKLI